jgi:hypothetical protein
MPETRRLLEAANALSVTLRTQGVPHAFYGSVFVALLTNSPQADVRRSTLFLLRRQTFDICVPYLVVQEIFCIVEGGSVHPFRRVRQALAGTADLSVTPSPWSDRYIL